MDISPQCVRFGSVCWLLGCSLVKRGFGLYGSASDFCSRLLFG